MRAAEATGNHEAALEWDDRMQRFRKDRHERRVDMIEVPLRVLLAIPKIALGLFLVLAVMGIFLGIATKHIAEIATPFEVVARHRRVDRHSGVGVVGSGRAGRTVDRPGRAVVDRPGARQRQSHRLAGPAQG